MQTDDAGGRRVPTLVSLCQRVAGAHVDSITNLGSEIRFYLAKPILEKCSAEQLLQIEDASPQLQHETHELWMDLCTRKFPKMAQRYLTGEEDHPETWKERFFAMQEAEARRLEELGSRLRSQRQEADERKREREVKLTDQLPPPKRPRTGWGTAAQSKSLFQKTRSEASKIQKAVYSTRMLPPMPPAKNYAVTAKPATPFLLPPPAQMNGQPNRVTVNTVKRPLYSPAASIPLKPPLASAPIPPSGFPETTSERMTMTQQIKPAPVSNLAAKPLLSRQSQSTASSSPPIDSASRPHIKSPRKDPMACLFLPKHRAFSQRPTKA